MAHTALVCYCCAGRPSAKAAAAVENPAARALLAGRKAPAPPVMMAAAPRAPLQMVLGNAPVVASEDYSWV